MIDSTPRDIADERASAIHYKPVVICYGRHISGDDKRRLYEVAKENIWIIRRGSMRCCIGSVKGKRKLWDKKDPLLMQ